MFVGSMRSRLFHFCSSVDRIFFCNKYDCGLHLQIQRKIQSLNLCKMPEKSNDNRLKTLTRICDEIANERSYNRKSKILEDFFTNGTDGNGFNGDLLLWIKMLLPADTQRVYNLQNKQILKLFSRIFSTSQDDMLLDLEQGGDISETIRVYFEKSVNFRSQKESTLFLKDVEEVLNQLENKTKEAEQTDTLNKLCKCSTSQDIKMVIRILNKDLKINAGPKHILDAFGRLAYPAFQASRDLEAIVREFGSKKAEAKANRIQVMTPISPMLANACNSVETAFSKNPEGVFSEIKYDGERVQIHKKNNEFKFFSRNLKPVVEHKIKRFKDFIPKAFPSGGDMILDSEIILVDTETGELLPFGSLGAHKKKEYAASEVCIFVFDCILFNGKDLTNMAFKERRKLLENNIKPIKTYVQLSESQFLKSKSELASMTAKVLKANLEGLVLKCPNSLYKPGKRGWLKIKKDYLFGGKMADTADLVVLGGSYGSGKKGGVLSIFLMGCFDQADGIWKTVTKVHSGLDDCTNNEIHEQLLPKLIRSDPKNLPYWLLCKKSLIPDYIAICPNDMPVWEITGAEFTKSDPQTSAGISIRFPRITRLRNDKSAKEANNLTHLYKLYSASKNNVNVDLLVGCSQAEDFYQTDNKTDIKTKNKHIKVENHKKIKLENTDTKCAVLDGAEYTSIDRKQNKTYSTDIKVENHKKIKLENTDTKSVVLDGAEYTSIDRKPNKTYSTDIKVENNKKIKLENIDTKSVVLGGAEYTSIDRKPDIIKVKIHKKIKRENTDTKLVELETAKYTSIDRKPNNAIFSEFIVYFLSSTFDESDRYLQKFLTYGGVVTKDSKKADIALYNPQEFNNKLTVCRHLFRPTCRHLSIKWLHESIDGHKLMSFAIYAICLKE